MRRIEASSIWDLTLWLPGLTNRAPWPRRFGTTTWWSRGGCPEQRVARLDLHRPAFGARGHQPAGVRRPATGRPAIAPARSDAGHRRSQRAHHRHRPADRRSGVAHQVETLAAKLRRIRRPSCIRMGDIEQGIVARVGPAVGPTQPGMTIVCGDSHTSTHGAFGALAMGIGTSEVEHVLVTPDTAVAGQSRHMRSTWTGLAFPGVTPRTILHPSVDDKIGTGGGRVDRIDIPGHTPFDAFAWK